MQRLYTVRGWHEVVRKIVERSVEADTPEEALRWAEANGMWHVVVTASAIDDGTPRAPAASRAKPAR